MSEFKPFFVAALPERKGRARPSKYDAAIALARSKPGAWCCVAERPAVAGRQPLASMVSSHFRKRYPDCEFAVRTDGTNARAYARVRDGVAPKVAPPAGPVKRGPGRPRKSA